MASVRLKEDVELLLGKFEGAEPRQEICKSNDWAQSQEHEGRREDREEDSALYLELHYIHESPRASGMLLVDPSRHEGRCDHNVALHLRPRNGDAPSFDHLSAMATAILQF